MKLSASWNATKTLSFAYKTVITQYILLQKSFED